ncbi:MULTISPECIES: acyltransferase family protein [Chromohalobacter]|uniref:Acyltransferase n=1 Tax=Chromohalobacter moromii TaxID=2860329 RepID=A0A9X3B869_9GAMM|nr:MULTISPECIES: acyltransferase [Chromohalobacter]MCK2047147.1 acyltransferase [Chromohalobacter moromii]MCT8468087.1 acyltransferase [Chromohalobacter canadensis]MCT8498586.1 acyltransferase [Chromohalobacter canadensis]MCT8506818.1 acyltransferase [Chromohalobacter moromii]
MQRNVSLDVLKLTLAVIVVISHAQVLMGYSDLGYQLTVEGLFRIVVPIFMMVSGYFFISVIRTKSLASWLKKVVSMYLFWMLVYVYFWLDIPAANSHDLLRLLRVAIMGYHHLWFLSALIGAAILLYMLRNFSMKVLLVWAVMLYGIGVSFMYAGNYDLFAGSRVDALLLEAWPYRNFLFFGFPFFCIGYLLRSWEGIRQLDRRYYAIWSLAGALLLLGESYLNYVSLEGLPHFDMYLSLLVFCPGLFLWVSSLHVPGDSTSLAYYATALYFIHPLFISLFEALSYRPGNMLAFLALASSLLAVMLLKGSRKRLGFAFGG